MKIYIDAPEKKIVNTSATFAFYHKVKTLFGANGSDFNFVANYQFNDALSTHKSYRNISFTDLLKGMLGIFPTDLFKLITEECLDIDYQVKEKMGFNVGWHQLVSDFDLPAPHLANYEWRYTEESSKRIVDIIKLDVNADTKICCLGTPSIALELIRNNIGRNTTFLDINEPLKELIEKTFGNKGITCKTYDAQNIPQSKFMGAFDYVIINPPWYLDYYELFISRAIDFLKANGGIVLVPLFPALSRHNALKDLGLLEHHLVHSKCIEINSKGYVEFEMPAFEKAILKKHKTPLPESNWRNAELVELKFDKQKKSLITENVKFEERKWLRFAADKLAIVVSDPLKIIENLKNKNSHTTKTYILPTVSRKKIKKTKIDIWDSDNRVTIVEKKNL